ncbi:hypothetical protein BELL_0674g00060 [Botrytis elliptica]|uniref:Uncharacterized protein n=1 Tax=Botrytis elliptica TaxID=278938 RepID=A0A4Z1JN54_9HELO|nr:hypothetical protein BELL_0674g00060 [Botrytis elliptica]
MSSTFHRHLMNDVCIIAFDSLLGIKGVIFPQGRRPLETANVESERANYYTRLIGPDITRILVSIPESFIYSYNEVVGHLEILSND